MTPQEKASALVDKYCELLKFDYPIDRSMKLCATRCAIICVEQITEVAWWSSTGELPEPYRGAQIEYWQEVLSYLKNS